MRTTQVITLCLGLLLVAFSAREVVEVRHYCSVVKDVQAATRQKMRMLNERLLQRGVSLTVATPTGDLSELDAVTSLLRAWWMVFGVGVAVSAVGTMGLVRVRREQLAAKVLEATAG